ncbi:universal stress protein [Streptomyces sp. NPDC050732]|uniref:universal stress protein n=1 Tax=Streptomyces sp. NPDC050732 TaxID=3154632 RepID=UPI0034496274
MELPLIVGVDGSPAALRALDWAVDEAVRRETPLRVVHASSWEWYEGHEPSFGVGGDAVQASADHVVERAVEHVRRRTAAVEVSGTVLSEDPAAALIRASGEASAVVVGSRGRGRLAGLLLGSVSLAVAARATAPVVVVRDTEGEPDPDAGARITVGVGEPGDSAAAVAFACDAAERRGATLRAVHAWRCPAHEAPARPRPSERTDPHQRRAEEELDEALRAPLRAHRTLTVRRDVPEGHARTALLDAARASDLLVVGAHRRKGQLGMQLGPVSHAVLHHAACPVAVVPHG